MHDWVKLYIVGVVVYVVLVGSSVVFLSAEVVSTFPLSVAPLLICWPVAYWFVYYREGKIPFQSNR